MSKPSKITVKKKWQIAGLLLYVSLASLFIYLFHPVYLITIFLVLVPPTVTNFLWLKNSRRKIFIFSLVSTLLLFPPVELSSRLANVWDVQSILFRPFGLIPMENMLFAFLNFIWVLSFYEFFVDKDSSSKISKRFKYIVGLYCLWSLIIFSIFAFNRQLISLNYFSTAVLILIVPGTVLFYAKPEIFKKTYLPTIFFAAVFFMYEVAALLIGNWWWPGHYLFPVTLAGKVFPLDDVIIWYFLSTPVLIAGYEFFMDDWR